MPAASLRGRQWTQWQSRGDGQTCGRLILTAPVMLKESNEALRQILLPCNVCGRHGKAAVTSATRVAQGGSVGQCCITYKSLRIRWPPQINLLHPSTFSGEELGVLYTLSAAELAKPHTELGTPWTWADKGFFTPFNFLWTMLFLCQAPCADHLHSSCDNEPRLYMMPLKAWISNKKGTSLWNLGNLICPSVEVVGRSAYCFR